MRSRRKGNIGSGYMVIEKTEIKPEEIRVKIKDPRAIAIIKRIPKEQFDEIVERYIILGDAVVSYASITPARETIEEFFAPLKTDIDTIRRQLQLIVPTIVTPAKKGKITVESIFKSYEEHFMDDTFEDISARGKYTDIKAIPAGTNQNVLIEIKDYSDTVPTYEVDKFWRDMETRDARYGIFVSMRTRITKISGDIKVVSRMKKTAVFVVNEKMSWSGHLFAYYVVRKLIEHETLMARKLKEEELTQVITKVNVVLKEIQKNMQIVEEIRNLAEVLRTTTRDKLDKIIEYAKSVKRNVEEKIDEAFQEIAKTEVK